MSQMIEDFRQALSQFIDSCGRSYEFPAGGQTAFLTQEESNLLDMFRESGLSDAEKIKATSEDRDWSDCYSIVIFGVRLAVMSVRQNDPNIFLLGILALVAGAPKVDWRDVLKAFAIFENCGNRMGVEFQPALQNAAAFSGNNELRSTVSGFASRSDDLRSIDVLGIIEVGDGDHLTFKARGLM